MLTFAAMLKRVTAILLLIALISTHFSRFFVYASSELNHTYIAEKLCINKSRPWLNCNGKCYFMRKMKEVQDNEKKQERADQKNRYQEALPVSWTLTALRFQEPAVKTIYPHIFTPKPVQRSYSIFLPPKVTYRS